tara:strand:- start:407 stop:682 length:276 start_codon:yes stop_codon:yes gene_type:complete
MDLSLLSFDLQELIGKNVVEIRHKIKAEHKDKFKSVIDCIYIQDEEMEEIEEDCNHQETCVSWILEVRYYNVEENFIHYKNTLSTRSQSRR